MTQKRKHVPSTSESLLYITSAKRPRSSVLDDVDEQTQPRLDPTYGQRGAFPGLDDLNEETVFYGPAGDGLEYLRMVRSEAKGVPNLLVAPLSPTAVPTNVYAEYEQGFYADGAYTAVPDPPGTKTGGGVIDDEDVDPQEACYASLCHRFDAMSSALRLAPPTSPAGQSSTLNPSSRAQWRRYILNTQPTSLILSYLGQEEVMQGVAVLESLLSTVKMQKHKSIGLWAWGLLVRCRDVGEMGSEEVGVLRDLGKKAIAVIRGVAAGMYEPDGMNGEDEVKDGDDGEMEAVQHCYIDGGIPYAPADAFGSRHPMEDSIAANHDTPKYQASCGDLPTDSPDLVAAAKQRLLDSLRQASPGTESPAQPDSIINSQFSKAIQLQQQEQADAEEDDDIKAAVTEAVKQLPKNNGEENERQLKMHATLDMIITIVGEKYGQKDLLPGRFLWDEMESSHIL